jgi:hypothetical protein
VAILTLLIITGVKFFLGLVHLSERTVPVIGITLSQWMFGLDIITATLINLVGVYRALKALLREEDK